MPHVGRYARQVSRYLRPKCLVRNDAVRQLAAVGNWPQMERFSSRRTSIRDPFSLPARKRFRCFAASGAPATWLKTIEIPPQLRSPELPFHWFPTFTKTRSPRSPRGYRPFRHGTLGASRGMDEPTTNASADSRRRKLRNPLVPSEIAVPPEGNKIFNQTAHSRTYCAAGGARPPPGESLNRRIWYASYCQPNLTSGTVLTCGK